MPDILLFFLSFCSEVSPKQASILCRAVIQIHEGEAFFTYSPMKCAYLPTLMGYQTKVVRMLTLPPSCLLRVWELQTAY